MSRRDEFVCKTEGCMWTTRRVRATNYWTERKPVPTVCPKCGGVVAKVEPQRRYVTRRAS